jgi:hypothetical protein
LPPGDALIAANERKSINIGAATGSGEPVAGRAI